MRRKSIIAALIAVAAVLGLAAPASAGVVCIGRQGTVGVCVEPNSWIYLGCYYLAEPQCTDVYAPAPDVVACWLWDPSVIMCD